MSKIFGSYSGASRPKILFIGEAWGREEEETRKPFVGESGKELWRMLGESAQAVLREPHLDLWQDAAKMHRYGPAWVGKREGWMNAVGIAYTNVLNFRPPNNNLADESVTVQKKDLPDKGKDYQFSSISKGRYLRHEHLPELYRVSEEVFHSNPNLVICLGAVACWSMLGVAEIGAIRGAITANSVGRKILPTYHPASVLYNWSNRPVLVADLMKGWREGEFREIRRPNRQIRIDPTLEEVREFRDFICNGCAATRLAIDTETSNGQIKCISFAWSKSDAFVVPFWVNAELPRSYWSSEEEELEVWDLIEQILMTPIPKLFQNGVYDLQYLFASHLRICNVSDDAMLLSHALFSEMPKSLGFLGSIHTDEPAWKLMRRRRPDTEKRDE